MKLNNNLNVVITSYDPYENIKSRINFSTMKRYKSKFKKEDEQHLVKYITNTYNEIISNYCAR